MKSIKKITTIFITIIQISILLIFTACDQPTEKETEKEVEFVAGWWKHQITYDNDIPTGIYFINYGDDKKIQRAGTESREFNEATIESLSNILPFDKCVEHLNLYSKTIFEKVDESDLPEWARNKNEADETDTNSSEENKQNNSENPTEPRPDTVIIIPTPYGATVNEETEIEYSEGYGNLTDDERQKI